jgi:O-antigen/teichoic acid export membrane protein
MKLGIVYLLSRAPIDRLSFYGLLQLGVCIVILVINFLYCKTHFSEVKFQRMRDKTYFKKMTQFAGWNFLGNTAYAVTQNGVNMLLNVFGGPAVNAARGIAFQVSEMTKQFLTNVNTVMTPYSIKAFAGERLEEFQKAIFISSKILFYVQLMLTIPLVYLTQWLISLWLGQVPEYAVVFLQLTLCISLIRSVHGPIDTIFKAKGELKYYQISEGIILAMPLVLGYIVLKFGAPYASVFVCCIAMELVNLFVMLILAHMIAGFNSRSYARHILLPSFLCIVCAGGMLYMVRQLQPIWIQVLISVISMGICSGLWWWIILTKEERTNILSLLPNYHVHDSQR